MDLPHSSSSSSSSAATTTNTFTPSPSRLNAAQQRAQILAEQEEADLLLYQTSSPHILSSYPVNPPPDVSPSFFLRTSSSVSAASSSTSPTTSSPSLLSSASRPFVPKQQLQHHHQQHVQQVQQQQPFYHLPRLDDEDPFSLDSLSAQVASSCLGDDEEEIGGGGGNGEHDGGGHVYGHLHHPHQHQQHHQYHLQQQQHGGGMDRSLSLSSSSDLANRLLLHQQQQQLQQQQQQQQQHHSPMLHHIGSGNGLMRAGAAGYFEGGLGGGLEGDEYGGSGHYDDDDKETTVEEDEAYVRDAALGVLMGAFPHCAPEALLVTLLKCDYDLDLAVQRLDGALKPRVPACRYFLSGFCARSDCSFSHAIDRMTCIHWLLGSCRDGLLDEESKTVHECPFLHDVIVHEQEHEGGGEGVGGEVNPSEASGPPFSATDEEHFPALSASATSTTPSTASTPSKSFLQVALTTAPPKTAMPAPPPPPLYSSSNSRNSSSLHNNQHNNLSRKRLESLWVMGGEEVRQTYLQARAEATQAAKARNQFFMQATQAFQRGDKAAAKALGREGRRWNAAMKARHKAAALAIFASRNPSESKIYEEGVLDLHGLHVQEALEALEELLPDIFQAGKTGEATLITGTGKHSGGVSRHQARLFPALEEWLQEVGGSLRGGERDDLYSYVTDPSGFQGGFRVRLSRRLAEHLGRGGGGGGVS